METKGRLTYALYLSTAAFYVIAGINHFVMPSWYLPLIPAYFSFPEAINTIAGVVEIIGGIGLLFALTKKTACNLLLLALVAFIPAHWHFIQEGSCIENSICVSPWIARVRLLIIHPLLIYILLWIKKSPYGFKHR